DAVRKREYRVAGRGKGRAPRETGDRKAHLSCERLVPCPLPPLLLLLLLHRGRCPPSPRFPLVSPLSQRCSSLSTSRGLPALPAGLYLSRRHPLPLLSNPIPFPLPSLYIIQSHPSLAFISSCTLSLLLCTTILPRPGYPSIHDLHFPLPHLIRRCRCSQGPRGRGCPLRPLGS
ncbi:hypothetical protein C8Q70DRAFT_1119269, partial [Cubamyces menziesii]